MKKCLVLIFILFLIGLSVSPVINANVSNLSNDQIDQQQTLWDGAALSMRYPALVAQSFKPSLNTITRIQIIAFKMNNPSGTITLSIRSLLDGEDIASVSINAEDLEIDSWPTKTWVEFNFGEIPVTPEETYYFIWRDEASEDDDLAFLAGYGDDVYTRGCSWINYGYGTWYEEEFCMDHCFITYGFYEERPDLSCEGSLSWNDVPGGSTVEGSFIVENIGDPGTNLDWEISEWPDWGTWTFTPTNGEDLTPEDGPVTVEVEVVAPDEHNEEFTGEIKIINSEDPRDYCIIDVSLELDAPELEIEITGGFGAHVVIRNVGDYDAIDVEWSVNITGGILGRIDHHFGGTIGILPAGNETTIEISSLIVGLGPIEIAVTADASNAEPVIETKNGFIFLFFVILR